MCFLSMENYVNAMSIKTFQLYVSTWKKNAVNGMSSSQPELRLSTSFINPETKLMLALFYHVLRRPA